MTDETVGLTPTLVITNTQQGKFLRSEIVLGSSLNPCQTQYQPAGKCVVSTDSLLWWENENQHIGYLLVIFLIALYCYAIYSHCKSDVIFAYLDSKCLLNFQFSLTSKLCRIYFFSCYGFRPLCCYFAICFMWALDNLCFDMSLSSIVRLISSIDQP